MLKNISKTYELVRQSILNHLIEVANGYQNPVKDWKKIPVSIEMDIQKYGLPEPIIANVQMNLEAAIATPEYDQVYCHGQEKQHYVKKFCQWFECELEAIHTKGMAHLLKTKSN